MPTVDVIVPCYNYAHFLPQCVESVLSQADVDVRVIVVDDASSDRTAEVGRDLAASDPRVEFHRHEVNLGHISTYNDGIALLRADYMVLLSADDLLTPGALARATELMEARPSVGLVYGYPIPLYGTTLRTPRTRTSGWTVWAGSEWIQLMCKSGRNFINCPEVVMRTRVQRQIGYYNPELPHSGDMEMWLRAAAIADIGHLNGVDQAYYRVHVASMQRTKYAGMLLDLGARRDAFESALAQAKGLPQASSLLSMARRALATAAVQHASALCDDRADYDGMEPYLEFAIQLFPGIVDTRPWRAVRRRRRGGRSLHARLLRHLRTTARESIDHLAWRRWRRTGVFRRP